MARTSKQVVSYLLVALVVALVSCSDDDSTQKTDSGPADAATSEEAGQGDLTSQPDGSQQGKVLTQSHLGWGNKTCFTAMCHVDPPTPGHTPGANPSTCAKCHGGNGACAPPKNGHTPAKNCVMGGCHGPTEHGYDKNETCVSCHYASAGTAACPR